MMEEDGGQAMTSGTSSRASTPDSIQQQEKSGTEKRFPMHCNVTNVAAEDIFVALLLTVMYSFRFDYLLKQTELFSHFMGQV